MIILQCSLQLLQVKKYSCTKYAANCRKPLDNHLQRGLYSATISTKATQANSLQIYLWYLTIKTTQMAKNVLLL